MFNRSGRRIMVFLPIVVALLHLSCTQDRSDPDKSAVGPIHSDSNRNSDVDSKNGPSRTPSIDDTEPLNLVELLQKTRGSDGKTVRQLIGNLERVTVSGVIAEVEPYKTNWSRDTFESEIRLESGIPNPNLTEIKEYLVECEFVAPEMLHGLSVGQTVIVSGDLPWTYDLHDGEAIHLENCKIKKAMPALISSLPKFTSAEAKEYLANDGVKLDDASDQLYENNLSPFDFFNDDLNTEIGIEDAAMTSNGAMSEESINAINAYPIVTLVNNGVLVEITDQTAKSFSRLKYVGGFRFDGKLLTDDGFDALTRVSGVSSLRLYFVSNFSPSVLQSLDNCPGLRELELHGEYEDHLFLGTADQAVAEVKRAKELRHLSLRYVDVSDEGLIGFAELPELRKLTLEECRCQGDGLAALSNLEHLWFLKLTGEQINDELAVGISELSELAAIELLRTSTTSKIGEGLQHLKNLQLLTAHRTQIDSKIGPYLRNLSLLKYLRLKNCLIDDALQLPVESLSSLQYLDLEANSVGPKICEQIGRSKTLERVQ